MSKTIQAIVILDRNGDSTFNYVGIVENCNSSIVCTVEAKPQAAVASFVARIKALLL